MQQSNGSLIFQDYETGARLWWAHVPAGCKGPFTTKLFPNGELSILDGAGAVKWTSKTSTYKGKSPFRLVIDMCNLILLDARNQSIWIAANKCNESPPDTMLNVWDQCGGETENPFQQEAGFTAADKQYDSTCCPAGWSCFRKDQFFQQCRPTKALDQGCVGAKVLELGEGCGGLNTCGRDGLCGQCCKSGLFCHRHNPDRWDCQGIVEFKFRLGGYSNISLASAAASATDSSSTVTRTATSLPTPAGKKASPSPSPKPKASPSPSPKPKASPSPSPKAKSSPAPKQSPPPKAKAAKAG